MLKFPAIFLILPAFAASTLATLAVTPALPPSDSTPIIAGLPGAMIWQHRPATWKIEEGKTLSISADKQTDWFVSPMDGERTDKSPRLLFKPADDFVISAKVTVGFRSQWDSGALVLYVNDSVWAKLCFEMTIEKHPAIVSVVTRNVSDDSNSIAVSGSSVFLKVAKSGQAVFFYASQDGQHWTIIRAFSLGPGSDLLVGFSSQSPAGDGCTSVFTEIEYLPKRVDLWAGK